MKPKIMILTSCSKSKLDRSSKAIELYQGQLFKMIVKLSRKIDAKLKILSAKYGLIDSDDVIEPYEKRIETMQDILRLKSATNDQFEKYLQNYDKILVIMGKKYRKVVEDYLDHPKVVIAIDKRGIGGYLQLISTLLKKEPKRLIEIISKQKVIELPT
ncbi:MAG: peroxide stress protein YaaA [Candidatus Lokiarchaeota archaeon]|nr:peroxide stress protein YaaA [Candidatus Lokiarchaeota archaeon]